MSGSKKILFVVMPWHSMHLPSLATGLLSTIVHQHCSATRYSVETLYANIQWAHYLEQATEGAVTPAKYALLGEDLFFQATGEWIFTPALHDDPEWQLAAYTKAFEGPAQDLELALAAYRVSAGFIDLLVDEIIAKAPDIVGLTSVFQQNVASLALAKQLKKRAPQIMVIMGGSNCDGVQGPALHRNYPFLDYVFSGESDYAFKRFLEYLDGSIGIDSVPNVSWRDSGGASVTNRHGQLPKASDFVIPFHDDYFVQAMDSPVSRHIEPNIIAESARGCWWGQKHHCTFCGLNGMGMAYRSKDPDVFLAELDYLIRRHQSLDVVLADNILDMKYLTTVLPAITARQWDVRIHYEIKANFKRDQLEALRDAGVWHVQPGIESLSTSVLRIMDKGTTGPQNVKLLRECEELNLTTTWNWLAGFPGETEDSYRHIERQIPALVHLQPPSGATRLAVERFSPYFNDRSLGFAERRPSLYYSMLYGLPREEVEDIVYIFDDDKAGVGDDVINDMQRAVEAWHTAYKSGSTLIKHDTSDAIVIEDRRAGWPRRDHVLGDSGSIALYRALGRPQSLAALAATAEIADAGETEQSIGEKVERFRADGLVFEDGGSFIALATDKIPFRLRLAA
jgi:ribosomal peptide maturation radical SAM protein 1